MSETRASIDRKLDALTARTTAVTDVAKDQVRRRGPAVALITAAVVIGSWWWRRSRH